MKRRPDFLARLLTQAPGLEHFDEVIAAANAGRPPAPETVEAIADAARHLYGTGKVRRRLESFGRELGMFVAQGKGRTTDKSAGTHARKLGAVGFVLQAERRLIEAGATPRKAARIALAEVATRVHVSMRTLTRWVHDLRDEAAARLERLTGNTD